MAQIKISIINASKTLNDDEVEAARPALQKQISGDFYPAWGVDAELDFVPKGKEPPEGQWWLVILDDSDQAGALGYHDMTADGLPLGKVFAGTDAQFGMEWTVTASHELLEMLGDPAINLTAISMTAFDINQPVIGRLWAYEVCDPCEADEDGYLIDGVLVSDFVYPEWFESFRPVGTQFDYQKRISDPFQLLPGGYASVYDMTSGTGWQQISKPLPKSKIPASSQRAPVGSRRERRRTPRNQWVSSTAHSRRRSAIS